MLSVINNNKNIRFFTVSSCKEGDTIGNLFKNKTKIVKSHRDAISMSRNGLVGEAVIEKGELIPTRIIVGSKDPLVFTTTTNNSVYSKKVRLNEVH